MHNALLPLLLLAVAAATSAAAPGPVLDVGPNKRGGRARETALVKAARLGRAEHVRILLEVTGVDAAAVDEKCRTALHHAAVSGSATMVQLLLNATGVDVNAVDADGHTPLYYAINGSHARLAMAMLNASELDVLARDGVDDTALHWAARAGHAALVSAVLERAPALINAKGSDGRTPLAVAVHSGHTESAMRLLAVPSVRLLGAVDAANVLHCAAAGGHVQLVRTVLAIAETDVNARDGGNATALMAAVWAGQVDTADALLAANGVDVAAQDSQGRTALMMAVDHDDAELLRLITSSNGVDECAADSHGCAQRCVNTAVGYRCECNDGHELDSDGRNCTALHPAATADTGEQQPAASCGGRVTGRSGTITSPNYPRGYAPNSRCTWDIVAPRGHTVYLDFANMDLEGNEQCGYDYVEVQSVDAEGDTVKRHGKFCRPVSGRIASATGRLRLVFASDQSNQERGFAARYFTARCAGRRTDSDCVREASGGGGDEADCIRPPRAPARSTYLDGA